MVRLEMVRLGIRSEMVSSGVRLEMISSGIRLEMVSLEMISSGIRLEMVSLEMVRLEMVRLEMVSSGLVRLVWIDSRVRVRVSRGLSPSLHHSRTRQEVMSPTHLKVDVSPAVRDGGERDHAAAAPFLQALQQQVG